MRSRTGKARRRGPGRPRGAAPQHREGLLDAAVRCYARAGIATTRMRDIAAEAGVTPALVNYYFGSKEKLLSAVVDERYLPVVAELRQRIDAAGRDPENVATSFVEAMHAAVRHHPWLPSLWVREILMDGGALRTLLLKHIAPQVPKVLAERFAEASRRGTLHADLDPRLLVVSLIGLTLFPLAAAPIWRRVLDAEDADEATLMRHSLALLRTGVGGSHAT